MTKQIKRISQRAMRTWLRMIKDAINARNYGQAEELIDGVMASLTCMEFKKIDRTEADQKGETQGC